jgi:PTS system nitrogen regulatory IIA component
MAQTAVLPDVVHVETILSPDRIIFFENLSKRDALIKLADNLSMSPQIKDKQELIDEILKREALMSTAIGCGIAIPHVRILSVTDLVVSVGISRTDITDFEPLDGEGVRLLFMIAAAYNQHTYYLQTLSFFSSHLKTAKLRQDLLSAHDAGEVFDLLARRI